MEGFLSTINDWIWLILGLVLMTLEVAVPGVFLFWLGLAALVVGVVTLGVSSMWGAVLPWQAQVLMFAVCAALAAPLWWRLIHRPSDVAAASPFLNRRSKALLGREFTLEKPILDGHGVVRVADTVWRVAGPDTPSGTRVKVVDVDGANLTVTPV
ncbi:MAG: NfeD family protein [Alphaproteobacteria bacterium]|nr:NfeD family protein [Alphaproteobacteria bacterium]